MSVGTSQLPTAINGLQHHLAAVTASTE